MIVSDQGETRQFGDSSLSINYDKIANKIVFDATVPDGQYFSIGFGPDMTDTDMILWQSNGIESQQRDLWSTSQTRPEIDTQNSYVTKIERSEGGDQVRFTSTRDLDTGDSADFVIPLDEPQTWSWAYRTEDSAFDLHSERGTFDITIDSSGVIEQGITEGENEGSKQRDFFARHGQFLWTGWIIGGYLLLATKRYLKRFPRATHYAHALIGHYLNLITLIMAFRALGQLGWTIPEDGGFKLHAVLGIAILCTVLLADGSGTLTAVYMKFADEKPWKVKETMLKIARIHRVFSYFILFVGALSVCTGITQYYQKYKDKSNSPLGYICLACFITLVIISEVVHRVLRRQAPIELTPPPANKHLGKQMTAAEVAAEVKTGRNLVLMDNLVLDFTDYKYFHPGGKFVLTKCIGRDISKFFYGGYTLVNQRDDTYVHNHSQGALDICRSMVIATLANQDDANLPIQCVVTKKHEMINKNTRTFTFEEISQRKLADYRKWYDLDMIGHHFLVYSRDFMQTKRHYTICSSIVPELHTQLLSVCDHVIAQGNVGDSFDARLVDSAKQSSISLTLKLYETEHGVSKQLHRIEIDNKVERVPRSHEIFNVKGPMGKGLQIQESGWHLAFCAGTGILVYLDMVAYLILQNSGCLPRESKRLGGDFKFHLYCSFQNREQAIGLELCEKLVKLNEALGCDNFKLTVRLSEDKERTEGRPARWDLDYLKSQLEPHLPHTIKRIWVCGPPIMNETFDKAFEKIGEEFGLTEEHIEIM